MISHEFAPAALVYDNRHPKNELVAGFDWRHWNFRSDKADDFGGGFAGPSLEKGKQRTDAWYIQDTLQVTDSTRLSLGGRTETLDVERAVPFALTMTPVTQSEKRQLHAWSLSIQQTLATNLTAHARTGTSYRLPNIDEKPLLRGKLQLAQTANLD